MAVDAVNKYGFSEYPLDHPLYNTSNKKALGYFKDEFNSAALVEFVGLRPKCYASLCSGKVDRHSVTRKENCKGCKTSLLRCIAKLSLFRL